MTDYRRIEQELMTHLRLERRPVGIALRDAPPAGVERFVGVEPSGYRIC